MNQRDDASPEAWEIGGIDRQLPAREQLAQLASYLQAHYDLPDFTPPWHRAAAADVAAARAAADNFCAKLPDRTTHAAMLVLGSGVDHAMPGVTFTNGIEVIDHPGIAAVELRPAAAGARPWVVSLHPGGWWHGAGAALEMSWRPQAAAVANLSGASVLDVDYPLAPEHTVADMLAAVKDAADFARAQGASSVALWGTGSAAGLALLASGSFTLADALILTHPNLTSLSTLPDTLRAGQSLEAIAHAGRPWPPTLLQLADAPSPTTREPTLLEASAFEALEVKEYPACWLAAVDAAVVDAAAADAAGPVVGSPVVETPAVARQRVEDIARFIRG